MFKKYFLVATAIGLLLSGCGIQSIIKKAKHLYAEYTGKDTRGKRPFKVVYQSPSAPKTPIIVSACSQNRKVDFRYYPNPTAAAQNYFRDTNGLISSAGGSLKPFWDMRYVNSASRYIDGGSHSEYANHARYSNLDARSGSENVENGTSVAQTDPSGSVTQARCSKGAIAAGTVINLYDAPDQYLEYAGVQSSFVYRLAPSSRVYPWKSNKSGNLAIQANFDYPFYHNYGGNIGGGVYFAFFLKNRKTGVQLNYIVGVYAAGEAWMKEKAGIRFDPTTNVVHVATVISDDSWWSTKSPSSQPITEIFEQKKGDGGDNNSWDNFFRVNVSYQNLLAVLNELRKNPPPQVAGRDFGLSPEDWQLTSIMVQYELEEEGGKAILGGSFRGFEVYSSNLPF